MDELKKFLGQFNTHEVKTAQKMLRLPKDTQVDADKLLKCSVSYNYDPDEIKRSREIAEKLIIDELKKRLKVLGVDKLPCKYSSLIGLNILHPFVYGNIGIQQSVRLVWTGYFYLEFNPAILRSDNYCIQEEQLDMLVALKNNLDLNSQQATNRPINDLVPYLNHQIGKTTLLLNWAFKQAQKNPDKLYEYVVPTRNQAKRLSKDFTNTHATANNLRIVSESQFYETIAMSSPQPNPNAVLRDCQIILDEVDTLPSWGVTFNSVGYSPVTSINLSQAHYDNHYRSIEIPLDIQDS
jgi:hypothetical protein